MYQENLGLETFLQVGKLRLHKFCQKTFYYRRYDKSKFKKKSIFLIPDYHLF